MPLFSPLTRLVHLALNSYRRRRADPERQFVTHYRYSSTKPVLMQSRPFELFYRPRVMWTVAQFLAFALLAAWTVKNYMHVLQNFKA